MDAATVAKAEISFEKTTAGLAARLTGPWTVATVGEVYGPSSAAPLTGAAALVVDGGGLERLDTAGAWVVHRLRREAEAQGVTVRLDGFNEAQAALLAEVAKNDHPCAVEPPRRPGAIQLVADLGQGTWEAWQAGVSLVNFLGLVTATVAYVAARPWRMRWTSLVHHMEQVGVKAMPIVGLMAFLIGIVIAQQGEFQLKRFGADVFVVDLVAVSILREIAILLTAIMLAGRSGSAFTAQIGTMVLNEEVDAMRTLGIDPIETLVLPRLFAIMLMMPLLTFYADILGMVGGGMFCWLALDMTPAAYIERLHLAITMDSFLVGIIKAPFFAAVIAIAGCYEGLKVSGSAESVGTQTTRSVVESIFLVIVLDAAFAVFFSAIDM